jgi:hypothetical protein
MSVTLTFTAQVKAGGKASVTIEPPQPESWRVSQVSVQQATAPIGATCTVKRNGVFVTYVIPTGDVAGGDPPIDLYGRAADRLTVEWEGCTPGDVGQVLAVYDPIK